MDGQFSVHWAIDHRALDVIENSIPGGADEILERLCEMLIERITDNMSGYYPPASDPGETPAIRTGDLVDSLEYEELEERKYRVWSTLSDTENPYDVFLEIGTYKMFARPWLEPSVMELEKEFGKAWRDLIDD